MDAIDTERLIASEYALPRGVYTLQIPGILALGGLVAFAMDSDLGMALAAATATGVALYMLWDWLFRLAPTRIFHLAAIGLLLGYGVGTLSSYLTLSHVGAFASYWGTSEHVLAQGMATILLICATLCFVGEWYEKPLLLPNLKIPVTPKSCFLIYLLTFGLMVAFYTHAMGFMGVDSGPVGSQQNPIVALLAICLTPLVGLCIASAIRAPKGKVRWSLIVCGVICAALQTTINRRAVFYMTIVTLFLLRTSGYRPQGKFLKNLMLFAALAGFAFVGITFYMLLRLAGYQDKKTAASLGGRIEVAAGWIADGSAMSRAFQANSSNIKTRSFVLGFYADAEEGSLKRTPALGVDLITSVVSGVPRVIFPDKFSGDFFGIQTLGEEDLSNRLFGLTYTDAANSIITAGVIDYGIMGAFLYPLILAFIIRKCLDISFRYVDDFSCIFLVGAALLILLPTETALYAYVSSVRNLILMAVGLYFYERMPRFAWHTSQSMS